MKSVNLPPRVLAIIAIFCCHGSVTAQIVSDPTRPPGASQGSGPAGDARAPELQSVIITPNHRAAIINGQRIEVGAQYGGARVVRITETEVTLRTDAGIEVLKMYPSIDKSGRTELSRGRTTASPASRAKGER
jgi:MSHA biogenesis protein MshK